MDFSFPLLSKEDIKVKVSSVCEDSVSLLLYKDARIDQAILDATVEPGYWKNSYERIGNTLFCTVSIYVPELKEWVSKSNAGSETAMEREKGAASDAFKRACTNWGIGRELYTAPPIVITKQDGAIIEERAPGTRDFICRQSFEVKDIAYDNKKITKLVIASGDRDVFTYERGAIKKAEASEPLDPYNAVVTAGQNTGKTLADIYKSANGAALCWIADNDKKAGPSARIIISRNKSLAEFYKKYKEEAK